ncbi:hypothetical protein ABFY53_00420, partial [Serratia nematodiphila]
DKCDQLSDGPALNLIGLIFPRIQRLLVARYGDSACICSMFPRTLRNYLANVGGKLMPIRTLSPQMPAAAPLKTL